MTTTSPGRSVGTMACSIHRRPEGPPIHVRRPRGQQTAAGSGSWRRCWDDRRRRARQDRRAGGPRGRSWAALARAARCPRPGASAAPCWSRPRSHRRRRGARRSTRLDAAARRGALRRSGGDPARLPAASLFCVMPTAWRERASVDRLVTISLACRRRRSSASVRSGSAANRSRTVASCGARVDVPCPPDFAGSTVPASRHWVSSFETKLTLTANRSATCVYFKPSKMPWITRSRRSIEYGFGTHGWPPRPASVVHHIYQRL
jgi:hypothetical protein